MNSNTIDERIVSMEFDNERFEKNINQSMRSLEALDETIDDSARGITGSFLDIDNGLSRLDLVFAGFYTKIGGYLADLSMKAVKFAKSLSFDQVNAGFAKYTAETLAVQTITSNTNNTLEETYAVLADILKYTDETSYHYDKMADTIANFANQGIALDKAALATKGIANWAAVSGAGIDKADFAMTALVKSIGMGYMSLQDWNTISRVAKMGNKTFVDTLIAEGEAMGKWKKGAITFQNFREEAFGTNHLIDTELMMKVLSIYGDETTVLGNKAKKAASEAKTFAEALGAVKDAVSTGYGLSFRYIFGDYVEGKTFWTGVQDAMLEVFTLGQEFRNNMLKTWHGLKNGGYLDFVHSLADAWEHLKQLAAPIGDAFKEAFDTTPLKSYTDAANAMAEAVNKFKRFVTFEFNFSTNVDELIESYKEFYGITRKGFDEKIFDEATKKAERNAKIIRTIKELFYNIFDSILFAKVIIQEAASSFSNAFKGVGDFAKDFINFIVSVSKFVRTFASAVNDTRFLTKIVGSIAKVINAVLSPAFNLLSKIMEALGSKLEWFKSKEGFSSLETVLNKIAGAFEWLANVLTTKAITPLINGIGKAFNFLKEKLEPLKGVLSNTKDALLEFFKAFKPKDTENLEKVGDRFGKFGQVLGSILNFLSGVLEKLLGWLTNLFKTLKPTEIMSMVKDFLINVLLVNLISFVKNFSWVMDSIAEAVKKFSGGDVVKNITKIGAALLLLAASMYIIASIDPAKMTLAMGAISALLYEIVALGESMSKIKGKDLDNGPMKAAKAMLVMSIAVLVLSAAIKSIGKMDFEDIIKGVGAVSVILYMLTEFAKKLTTSFSFERVAEGVGSLMAVAIAVDLLVIAVKSLGKLDLATLGKGLGSVGIILLEFVGFTKLLKDAKIDAGTGFAILEIAAAFIVLGKAVKIFGEMDTDTLTQGLGTIGITLAAFGAALNMYPKNMPAIGLGLVLVAAGLAIVSGVLKILAGMSIEELQNSIGALAVSIISLGVALQLAKGTLSGAAALLIVSAALIPFALAMKILASIPLKGIGKALLSILAVFGGFALVTAILGPLVVVLLAFSTVVLALGLGVMALATGLLLLNSIGAAAIGLVSVLLKSFIDAIPDISIAVANAILSFAQVLTAGIDVIRQLIEAIVLAILDVLIAAVPKVVELGVTLLTALIEGIGTVIPLLIDTILEIVLQLLKSIEDKLPDFIESGTNIVVAFIDGIASMAVKIIDAAFRMVITIINGIADAIRTHNTDLLEAGWNLLTAIWDGFWNAVLGLGQKLWDAGSKFVEGVKEGLDEKITLIKDWVFGIPGKVKQWITDKIQDIKDTGLNIINGIKDGLTNGEGGLFGKIGGIASGLLSKFKNVLGIQSPSKEFLKLGGYIDQGLANGISQYANLVNDPARQLAENAVGPVEEAVNTLNDLNLGEFSDPVVRPVLDLSEIQNGARNIGGMFGNGYSVGLGLGNVTGALSGSFAGGGNAPIINMTVNGADGQNVEELAAAVSRRLNSELRSRNSIWK